MDSIGETSAASVNSPVLGMMVVRVVCMLREVFPSGGTAWSDDKKLSHMTMTKNTWGIRLATYETN